MRQTQVPAAPTLAPAQRGATSAVNPWQAGAMQRAEAARREQATFGPLTPRVRNQINNLKKAIADKRRVIDFVESSGRRPFQGDLDDLAEAEAQLRALLVENPQLLQD